MPCPPSWEELEMMRFDYAFNDVTPKFTRYAAEIKATYTFIRDWNALHAISSIQTDIEKEMNIAAAYASEIPPRWGEKPIVYDGYPTDPVFKQLERQLQWYHEEVSKLELALCILRTWIMNHYISNDPLTAALQQGWETERNLHLKHRKEDRDAYIKKLDYEIQSYMSQLRTLTEGSYISSLEKHIEVLKLKQAEVIGLKDEVLLKNRTVF